ncbi:hypothetical protein RHODO2019_18275 (plasmid) [Rhodococcus antarcticus]|uniref:DUF2178 domain-containing protein n=1 Tax=Rhodococcus antarcticus TaxID=2987751 RepID=A0ABY6P563_9NOCA|nr:hypothetical protein [Rhodococcus antarcticus]UZJ26830.1 hypothetical protein RHODO2019_18275 [Rhodococcus antarcticus]
MPFKEKSTLAMTTILVLVFGGYFTIVMGRVSRSPGRDVAWVGLMVTVVVILVVLAAAAHAVIAISAPSQAGHEDERDRSFERRGAQVCGYVLATGIVGGLTLAMVDAPTFWIAQALLAALVLGEVAKGATVVAQYHRGA